MHRRHAELVAGASGPDPEDPEDPEAAVVSPVRASRHYTSLPSCRQAQAGTEACDQLLLVTVGYAMLRYVMLSTH